MTRRLTYGLIAVAVLLALAGGGVYVYFFSSLRTSPQALGLQTASPAATATPGASASTGDLAGKWTVSSGSVVGYRVKELFAGQSTKHEAVARTSTVSGGITVAGDPTSGYTIMSISITANLSGLHSVDQVAGRDVSQRDGVVSRQLQVQQFPNATFVATTASIPGPVAASKVSTTVQGDLTIHGVTKTVTATVQSQVVGGTVEVAGSASFAMSDFGVSPPFAPFVTVDSQVVVEFDIFLAKG
jgi:polyisoprenoid-binding protein YceI